MPKDSATLIVECQMALGISQTELGALVGKNRRTISRWQDRGATLLPSEAEALARALRPKRPDLADEVLALAVRPPPAEPAPPASPQVIEAILGAAAKAAGSTPEAVRPVVIAAFVMARELGGDVRSVAAGLVPSGE